MAVDDRTDDELDRYELEYLNETARCHTCGGEGFVESVAQETNRWGWDEDDVGECPNCGGSGLAKDCWYW